MSEQNSENDERKHAIVSFRKVFMTCRNTAQMTLKPINVRLGDSYPIVHRQSMPIKKNGRNNIEFAMVIVWLSEIPLKLV